MSSQTEKTVAEEQKEDKGQEEVEKGQEEIEKKVEEKAKKLADALATFKGAPTEDQIEKWKQQFGEVYCSGFSETELFIWRPINRLEFTQMQSTLAQSEEPVTQLDVEEVTVKSCILWASEYAQKSMTQKAGSLSTLHEQIMFNSNFMDPRVAQALVIKL